MGLFILPGRLKQELDDIANKWLNNEDIDTDTEMATVIKSNL